jgi:1,2-diacylglycerol-3-alpha-glucose alpha-1,2-galactosyltransferase
MTRPWQERPIRVNMVSESVFGFKGQGVHTAFVNFVDMLRSKPGVEVLVNSRQPCDILHAHTLGPLYWTLMRGYKGRRLMSAHVVPDSMDGSLAGWRHWGGLFSRYMVATYNSADLVLPVAPSVKKTLTGIGVTARQEVVHNPVDLGAFVPSPVLRARGRQRLNIAMRDRVALCVGQIQPRKGVEDFLEAARQNPGIQFVWAGGRPFSLLTADYFELNRRIVHATPNVHFAGVFDLGEMPAIYNAADLLFFPSFQETFGLCIAEAAACGLPLVMRDLPEYADLFGGHFLACGNPDGFHKALRLVLEEAQARRHWREASLELARAFAPGPLADRLLGLYRQLLGASPETRQVMGALTQGLG